VLKQASCLVVMLTLAPPLAAEPAPDAPELTRLLKEFLDGASRNDAAVHDRFWAPELIYTGSSGRRIGKADIMKDVRPPATPAPSPTPTPTPSEPQTVYSAEDIRIQQYGNTAIVAFRLVGTTGTGPQTTVARYLNSGTFLKREGKWQVVNWQATRARRSEDEDKQAIAAVLAALRPALQKADAKTLERLVDENFVWMRPDGTQVSRKQLLEPPASGSPAPPTLEDKAGTITLHGDAAVVRGAAYTLTLVYDGAAWKAVALHTNAAPSSGSSR
jgi:hypothetical protein